MANSSTQFEAYDQATTDQGGGAGLSIGNSANGDHQLRTLSADATSGLLHTQNASTVSTALAIERLTTVTTSADTDLIPIYNGTNTRNITKADLLSSVSAANAETYIASETQRSGTFATTDTDTGAGDGLNGIRKQFDFNNQTVPFAAPTGKKWIVRLTVHAKAANSANRHAQPLRFNLEPTVQYGNSTISGVDAQDNTWVPANVLIVSDDTTSGVFEVPAANETNWVAGVVYTMGWDGAANRPTFDIGISEVTPWMEYYLVDV